MDYDGLVDEMDGGFGDVSMEGSSISDLLLVVSARTLAEEQEENKEEGEGEDGKYVQWIKKLPFYKIY